VAASWTVDYWTSEQASSYSPTFNYW